MATTTKSSTTTSESVVEEIKELNLEQKVTVKNIAGWVVGFSRKVDMFGDVVVPPNGSIRLSRNEIIAQVQSGNKLFAGTDGKGSHATLFIDDKLTREEVEFDTSETSQIIFSENVIKTLFNIKTQKKFEEEFVVAIKTRAEKYAAMSTIKKLSLNDYSKIRFAEKYTGYKLEVV